MTNHPEQPAIPLAARLGFTLWMIFWATVILNIEGPWHFFWLCNMAQFIILYAVWRNNRLLLASQAGTVFLIGLVWTLDFLVALALGGRSPLGITAYMFNEELALLARASSLYHVGLPPFLLWLLWRVGYDQRGPWLQCGIAVIGIAGGWLFTEPDRNVNWLYQPFGIEQTWMPEPLWVLVLLVACPLLIFFPGHFLVRAILRRLPGK